MQTKRARRFMQVDVFSQKPYLGNPLAVVLDGEDLSDAEMQGFARWTNLSETTFLLPPTAEGKVQGADYRVRIFTPGGELPFAGHPTLGSCHAWVASVGVPQTAGVVIQECAKGLVPLRQDESSGQRWAFAAPAMNQQAIGEAQLVKALAAIGLAREQIWDCAILQNGPSFWALLLDEPDAVLALTPDVAALHLLGVELGVAARYPHASEHSSMSIPDVEVRLWFNTGATLTEDPITGSFNASLAQWLIQGGHIEAPYVASQGVNLGRAGNVQITQDARGQVWVGGQVSGCISGTVQL